MLDKFITSKTDSNIIDNEVEVHLVRTKSAGVFFGEIIELNMQNRYCMMKNARRAWYWDGASSLSQLAIDGTSKPENCKFPCEVPEVLLFEVIEILELSKKAKKSLKSVEIWSQ